MGDFKCPNAFHTFARKVLKTSRYIRDAESDEFLATVLRQARSRQHVIRAGSIFWRAQLGEDWMEDDEGGEFPTGNPPDRMKPFRDRAKEGRANPKGIPHLYVATTEETAMLEMRPWLGVALSVAQFKVLRDLTIVNCSTDGRRKHLLGGVPPEKWDQSVWEDIDEAFSRPVSPTDDEAHYVPTQILSELFRMNDFDGVAYRSGFGEGRNVVIFDVDAADLINCAAYSVKNMKFEFSQSSNPYFVSKHYPRRDRVAEESAPSTDGSADPGSPTGSPE